MSRCQSLQSKLQTVHELQAQTQASFDLGRQRKDFTEALALKAKLEQALADLKRELLTDISATYAYIDPATRQEVPNTKETITLDIEKALESWITFYQEYAISLPHDFKERIQDIWLRNADAIRESVESHGFDHLLLIPEGLSLPDLETKMSQGYNATFQGENFKAGGSFPGVKEVVSQTRIILIHQSKARNLGDRPELKATLGKTAQTFIDQGEQLTLADYLIYQRQYFKETDKHLDEIGWTWLPGSKSGARFVDAYWIPGNRKLHVYADDAGYSNDSLGCRLSRCFV